MEQYLVDIDGGDTDRAVQTEGAERWEHCGGTDGEHHDVGDAGHGDGDTGAAHGQPDDLVRAQATALPGSHDVVVALKVGD